MNCLVFRVFHVGMFVPGCPDELEPMGSEEEQPMATEAYCVKCREKREMKNEEAVTLKNGRPAVQGVCPVCSTKLFRLMSTKKKD